MEIGKYEQFGLTKPPDSKISMFKPQRFFNLQVLKHRDSKISMFWNTAKKKFFSLKYQF